MPDEPVGQNPSENLESEPAASPLFDSTAKARAMTKERNKPKVLAERTTKHLLDTVKNGELALIFINAVLLVVTTIMACIYSGQLTAMKRATDESIKATKASEQSAYAACVNAKVAEETLNEIRSGEGDTRVTTDSLANQSAVAVRSEAAQITASAEWNLDPIEFRFPLHFGNIGRSTALDVESKVVVGFTKVGEKIKFAYRQGTVNPNDAGAITQGQMLSPNSVYMLRGGNKVVLTPEQINTWIQGKGYVFVYGTFTYKDIFGQEHWTRFCSHWGNYMKGDAYRQCAEYNHIDSIPLIKEREVPKASATTLAIVCRKPPE